MNVAALRQPLASAVAHGLTDWLVLPEQEAAELAVGDPLAVWAGDRVFVNDGRGWV